MQLAPTEDQSKISRWCYLPATLLLLFPTRTNPCATATARDLSQSMLLVSTAICWLTWPVHPAHCPLLFPTAHNSMCHCHSRRLVPVAITGRHCNWLADLAERSAALCTPHTAWCCFRQRTNPCATATARDLSQSQSRSPCSLLADLALARCYFRQHTNPCATATARILS